MIIEALAWRCPNTQCPRSAKPILVRYRPDYLWSYDPGDLPDGIEHREWESEDLRNTALDGFMLESGLFCTCGAAMRRT